MAQENKKTRYQELYEKEIVPALQKKYGYENVHQIPKLEKIVLNMGVGEATQDRKHIENAVADMAAISGQKPVINKAKQSNASFKVREDQAIGCKVTLRRAQMYEFLDRLVTITMPRIRAFRGINGKSFDGRGNYAMGMNEQIVFPEINYDKVDTIRGLDIVICTSANTNEEAKELLRGFKMPFKN